MTTRPGGRSPRRSSRGARAGAPSSYKRQRGDGDQRVARDRTATGRARPRRRAAGPHEEAELRAPTSSGRNRDVRDHDAERVDVLPVFLAPASPSSEQDGRQDQGRAAKRCSVGVHGSTRSCQAWARTTDDARAGGAAAWRPPVPTCPSSAISDGTSNERTTNASIRTPNATRVPICWMNGIALGRRRRRSRPPTGSPRRSRPRPVRSDADRDGLTLALRPVARFLDAAEQEHAVVGREREDQRGRDQEVGRLDAVVGRVAEHALKRPCCRAAPAARARRRRSARSSRSAFSGSTIEPVISHSRTNVGPASAVSASGSRRRSWPAGR